MTEQPEQMSRADLLELSPSGVRDALREGRLDDLLAGRDVGAVAHAVVEDEQEPPPPPGDADLGARGGAPIGQVRRADLLGMTPEAVRDALRTGELDALLRGEE